MASTPAWHTESFPELRDAPPWVMAEMIEAEPDLLEEIATAVDTSPLALLIRGAADRRCRLRHERARLAGGGGDADRGRHARDIAGGVRGPLDPSRGGAVIGVSHEGGTAATVSAMEAARTAGAATALITARTDSSRHEAADAVLATPFIDRSWCHTVGYTSPIAAGLALAARTARRARGTTCASAGLALPRRGGRAGRAAGGAASG